jgi:ATP-binding cassette, subfamily C (CFTR/MRP), member 1
MSPARIAWNQGVQTRVGRVSTALSHMKGIKMMGLSNYMLRDIQALRVAELKLSTKFRYLVIWVVMLC